MEKTDFERSRSQFRIWLAGLDEIELLDVAEDLKTRLEYEVKQAGVIKLSRFYMEGGLS